MRDGVLNAQHPLLNVRRRTAAEDTAHSITELLILAIGVPSDLCVVAAPRAGGADVGIRRDSAVQAGVSVGGG